MRKILVPIVSATLVLIMIPAPAFALFTVTQGGTGWSSFTPGALIYGNGSSPFGTTTAGTAGYVLQFNGSIPTWVSTSSLGIVAQPAGSNGEVQFNDGGSFSGDARLVWDKSSNIFSVHSATGTHTLRIGTSPCGVCEVPSDVPYLFGNSPDGVWIQGSDVVGATEEGAAVNIFGSPGGLTSGKGGDLNLNAGSAQGGDSEGGDIQFTSGDSAGAADGGKVEAQSGSGGITGAGGNFLVNAGTGGSSSGDGGLIRLRAGSASGGNSNGGDISFIAGVGQGAGTTGRYRFYNPVFPGTVSGILDTSLLSTGDKAFTLPNFSGTFGLLEATQIWSGNNTFSKGASATTTVNFGEISEATSRSCFNTKNADGDDISFYFVGTAMVVENNICQ